MNIRKLWEKKLFNISPENITKALNGEDFEYSGRPPEYIMEMLRQANCKNKPYLQAIIQLREDIPECDIVGNLYPDCVKALWKLGDNIL